MSKVLIPFDSPLRVLDVSPADYREAKALGFDRIYGLVLREVANPSDGRAER